MRPITSVPPPAANGTISLICRAGQACAIASVEVAHSSASAVTSFTVLILILPRRSWAASDRRRDGVAHPLRLGLAAKVRRQRPAVRHHLGDGGLDAFRRRCGLR